MLYALNGLSFPYTLKYKGLEVAKILKDPNTGKTLIRIDPPRDLTPALREHIISVVQRALRAMIEGMDDELN